jgi:putative transposase
MTRQLIQHNGGELHDYVRIRGARHRVESRRADGTRIYFRLQDGEQIKLSRAEQIHLAYRGELTTDASWDDVQVKYSEVLTLDFGPGGFTDAEIASAYHKLKYLTALDKYDAKQRVKAKIIKDAIAQAKHDNPELPDEAPHVATVRRWDYRWLASGRDPRVLADRHQDRGGKEAHRESAWVTEIILAAIEEKALQEPYFGAKQIEDYVKPLVARRMKEDETLTIDPRLGANRYFGVNRVATLMLELNEEEKLRRKVGAREARRAGKGVSSGPTGEFALHEAEADHHQLDIEVVLPNGTVWGRPWLTVIFDRYSRFILGFYITMEPPNWFSVLMALRVAVTPKETLLASFGYDFAFDWQCWGSPDFLFVDRGAEFRSLTMKASAAALRVVMVDVPRARGDMKGKIERWFGTYENQIYKLPGYLGSAPSKRIREKAKPRLTLAEVKLISAVYIVDIYNNTRHSKTRQWPSKRFAASMENGMINKLPPPPELLGPATSQAITGRLTREGVVVEKALYRADGLRRLWSDHGNMQVLCRPDEADATRMLVHNGARKYIEAELSGKYKGKKLTRQELKLLIVADNAVTETPEEHEMQMRALGNYNDLIDSVSPKPRKVRRARPKTTPVQHQTKPVFDPVASSEPLRGYDPDRPVDAQKYDAAGNYDGPGISEQVLSGNFEPSTAWNFSTTSPPEHSRGVSLPALAPDSGVDDDVLLGKVVPGNDDDDDDDDDGIIRL